MTLAVGPLASHAGAGEVLIVADGSFDHEEFLREIEIYPDGEHDDQVDPASLALNELVRNPIYNLTGMGPNVEDLRKENYWAPTPIPRGVNIEDGWLAERITEERKVHLQRDRGDDDLMARMMAIWDV